jgi:hypothetical protein
MALNIHKRLKNIYRFDVNFSIQKRNLDSIIGRTAHIRIIDDVNFWKIVALKYFHFFC